MSDIPLRSQSISSFLARLSRSAVGGGRSTAHLFWILLTRILIFGVFVDTLQLGLFLHSGARLLALMHVAIIAICLTAIWLLKRRRNRLAIILLCGEIVARACLGTALAGWAAGYHYYLLMVVPSVIVTAPRREALRVLTLLWLFYVALLFTMRVFPPLEPLDPNCLILLQALNVSALFTVVSYFTFMYRGFASSSEQRLKLLATTDPLTGLFNRRYANEMITREARHVERGSRPLSFILADIDHFKSVNDKYGHDGGDAVLVAVSSALAGVTRAENILSRWGGEEFLFVLPATSRQGAASLAERIHQMMQELRLRVGESEIQVTLTMGIAAVEPDESWGMALARADRALYEGKRSGRNCVRLDRDVPAAAGMEADPPLHPACNQAA